MSDTRITYRMADGKKVIRGEFDDTLEPSDLYHVTGKDVIQEQWKLLRSRVINIEHCQACISGDGGGENGYCPACDDECVIVQPKNEWAESESIPSAEEFRDVLVALGGLIVVSTGWKSTGQLANDLIVRMAKLFGIDPFEGMTVETVTESVTATQDITTSTTTATADWTKLQ